MDTVSPSPDKTADRELPPPRITPYFAARLEQAAASLGLPPEPWAA